MMQFVHRYWIATAASLSLSFIIFGMTTRRAALVKSEPSVSKGFAGSVVSPGREYPSFEYINDVPLFAARPGNSIPALYHPELVNPLSTAGWLNDNDFVVGVKVGLDSRAYPIRILNYHEIVNDEIAGQPVVVTYCPLAGSAVTFGRKLEGKLLSFSVANVLYESTLVMKDTPTGSLWYQLRGEAIKGALKGSSLLALPTQLCTWQYWLAQHPDTLVLSYRTGYSTNYASNYRRNPYSMGSSLKSPPGYPVTFLDDSRPPKEVVLGVALGGRNIVFPSTILRTGKARIQMEGRTLLAEYNELGQCPLAFWEVDGRREPALATTCYWFAWKAAHWDSEVWVDVATDDSSGF